MGARVCVCVHTVQVQVLRSCQLSCEGFTHLTIAR